MSSAPEGPREILRKFAPFAIIGWAVLSALAFYMILSGERTPAAIVFVCLTFWVPVCVVGIWTEMRRSWLDQKEQRRDVTVPVGAITSAIAAFVVLAMLAVFVVPAVVAQMRGPDIPGHIRTKYGLD